MNAQLTAFLALLRRFPFAAACVLVTLLCGVGAYFLWDDIQVQEAARLDRQKEGEATLELLVGGSTQRQELAAVRDAARRIEDNLVRENDLADNQWYFYKFEEQTKSHLLELHPQSSPPANDTTMFKRVPYSLRLTGTFEQVAAYLLAIETGPRLANITSFALSRRDRDTNALSLELNLELLGKK